MIRQIIAICDTEEEYSKAFVAYMQKNKNRGFDYIGFSSVNQILNFSNENKISLLLINRELFSETLNQIGCQIIFLDDNDIAIGENSVYKYQNVNLIINQLEESFKTELINKKDSRAITAAASIIGVFSPIGRSGKSIFSVTMAGILGISRSVLYINLEAICGFEWAYAKNGEADLADLIYNLRQGSLDKSRLDLAIKNSTQFDYLPVAICADDIKLIRRTDILGLIDIISELNRYKVIIIEFTELIDDYIGLIGSLDKVYMPVLDDEISIVKLRRFLSLLGRTDGSIDKEKIIPLALPKCDDYLLSENIDRLFYSNLGAYIKGVLQEE